MVFRRYFFLWFSFFGICFGLILAASLYPLWLADRKQQVAEENYLASALNGEFALLAPNSPLVESWDWAEIYSRFQKTHPRLLGMALVDNVDGSSLHRFGDLPPSWEPTLEPVRDEAPQWIDSSAQTRFWTVLPGGKVRNRHRLYVNVGNLNRFGDFLYDYRFVILGEIAFLVGLFLFFYWRWGNPMRFLKPAAAAAQCSIENAETQLPFSSLNLPGEFEPISRSISLLLEARSREWEERKRLQDRLEHSLRQKNQYSQMVQSIQEFRDSEMSAVETMQATLLRVNREPVIILDRTKRILSMNEAAKRVLSLSGQTGYPLRHPEIEEALKSLLESDRPGAARSIALRDPYLGKTTVWKISTLVQNDAKDKTQIDQIVVSLNKEEVNPQKGAPSSKDLLYLYSSAWFESWNHAGSLPTLMDEEERRLVEPLLREVFDCEGKRIDAEQLHPTFGLPIQSALPGLRQRRLVGGTQKLWALFEKWFLHVLKRMTSERAVARLVEAGGTRYRIEWATGAKLPFEDWFGQKTDNTLRFRNQLVRKLLERTQSNIVWDPENPRVVVLEFRVFSETCPPVLPKTDPQPQVTAAQTTLV